MKIQIPGWNKYYMGLAEQVKIRSKDRSVQVGAVIVRDNHSVLSVGYNGFPANINDTVDERYERPSKYMWTEHAERNAIYSAARNGINLSGSMIYISASGLPPCADCARAIIQSGIKEVIYMGGEFMGTGDWRKSCEVALEMLHESGIIVKKLNSNYEEEIV